jgi:hypothetical protein
MNAFVKKKMSSLFKVILITWLLDVINWLKSLKRTFQKQHKKTAFGVFHENDQAHNPCYRHSRSFYVLLAVDGTVSHLYTNFQSPLVQGFPEQY